jgi:multidrug efflux pump subunit AcrA (membrane-fusion protein)
MSDLLELDDTDLGVEAGTSQGEPDSTAKVTPSSRQPKVNLDELEEFRKYKSEAQKREARILRNQQELQQRLDAEASRRRQVELSGMDETNRAKYERDEALRALQAHQDQQQRDMAAWQWEQILKEISTETGIDFDDLNEKANDVNHAWKLGHAYEKKNSGKREVSYAEDNDDDLLEETPRPRRVDVGGGKTSSEKERAERTYKKALQDCDLDKMLAAEEYAIRKGFKLDHM